MTNADFLRDMANWLQKMGDEAEGKRLLKIADKLIELDGRDAILTALENGGVDNWDWYGASLEDAGL
jgi:hypothetical protein